MVFGEDICYLIMCWNMSYHDIFMNFFTYKVIIHLYAFGSGMKNEIRDQRYCSHVITP